MFFLLFFIHNILDDQTSYDAISFSRWEAHGSENTQYTQIWWCFIWMSSVGCVASLLLMVFDHKLINYGLFWMSVSGLEMFSLFSVFQFQFSYLSNVNVLLFFPSLWRIHAQFRLGQCFVFFYLLFLAFTVRAKILFIDFSVRKTLSFFLSIFALDVVYVCLIGILWLVRNDWNAVGYNLI